MQALVADIEGLFEKTLARVRDAVHSQGTKLSVALDAFQIHAYELANMCAELHAANAIIAYAERCERAAGRKPAAVAGVEDGAARCAEACIRTLFSTPVIIFFTHFLPIFPHFSPIFSVWTPGIQRTQPEVQGKTGKNR